MKGISIVVCCFNSEQRIDDVLFNIVSQRFETNIPCEVVLVDNCSTDNTILTAKNYWKQHNVEIPLVVCFATTPGLRYARETGLEHSSYDYLIFVDDDNWLAPDYLQTAYSILVSNPKVGVVGGCGVPVSMEPLPSWFPFFQNLYAVGNPVPSSGVLPVGEGYIYGAGMVVRKSVTELLGTLGFSFFCTDRVGVKLSGGHDVEISFAARLIGFDVFFAQNLRFQHLIEVRKLSLDYLKRISRGSASSFISFVYYLLLKKKVDTNFLFIYFYSKRIIAGILDYVRLSRAQRLDYPFRTIESTQHIASALYLIRNAYAAFCYFSMIRIIYLKLRS